MTSLRCPECGKTFDAERSPALPFCSPLCKVLDLRRWLDEEHTLPHVVVDDGEDQPPEMPD